MTDELKPVRCGCGGEAEIVHGGHFGSVFCTNCGIQTSYYDTESEAITAWNRAMGERKKGKWVVHDYAFGRERYECTECRGRCDLEYNFCPNCGAEKMR